jgi:hypothetical protein
MNISDILNYGGKERKEDYYALLGCDRSATVEQITAEYRVRARRLHPDKQKVNDLGENPSKDAHPVEEQDTTEEFQLLQEVFCITYNLYMQARLNVCLVIICLKAKNTLTNPEERARYDKWLDSGLAISFKQWLSLKDAVHTSMHWATPRTIGRMITEQGKKATRYFGTVTLFHHGFYSKFGKLIYSPKAF